MKKINLAIFVILSSMILASCERPIRDYVGNRFPNILVKFRDPAYADFVLTNDSKDFYNIDSIVLFTHWAKSITLWHATHKNDTGFVFGGISGLAFHGSKLRPFTSPWIKVSDNYYMFSWQFACDFGYWTYWNPSYAHYKHSYLMPIKWTEYDGECKTWGLSDTIYMASDIFEDIRAFTYKGVYKYYPEIADRYINILRTPARSDEVHSVAEKYAAIDTLNKYSKMTIERAILEGDFDAVSQHLEEPYAIFEESGQRKPRKR